MYVDSRESDNVVVVFCIQKKDLHYWFRDVALLVNEKNLKMRSLISQLSRRKTVACVAQNLTEQFKTVLRIANITYSI